MAVHGATEQAAIVSVICRIVPSRFDRRPTNLAGSHGLKWVPRIAGAADSPRCYGAKGLRPARAFGVRGKAVHELA